MNDEQIMNIETNRMLFECPLLLKQNFIGSPAASSFSKDSTTFSILNNISFLLKLISLMFINLMMN